MDGACGVRSIDDKSEKIKEQKYRTLRLIAGIFFLGLLALFCVCGNKSTQKCGRGVTAEQKR